MADVMCDAVMQAILTDVPAVALGSPTATAVAFRTVVPKLTDTERALLSEWLDRATGI